MSTKIQYFIREMPMIKQEVVEASEVVEMCQPQPLLSTPALESVKKECNRQKRQKQSANVKLLLKLQ